MTQRDELIQYIDDMLGSHTNLYKFHFGEDSDPEIDVCRKGLKKVREYLETRPTPQREKVDVGRVEEIIDLYNGKDCPIDGGKCTWAEYRKHFAQAVIEEIYGGKE